MDDAHVAKLVDEPAKVKLTPLVRRALTAALAARGMSVSARRANRVH